VRVESSRVDSGIFIVIVGSSGFIRSIQLRGNWLLSQHDPDIIQELCLESERSTDRAMAVVPNNNFNTSHSLAPSQDSPGYPVDSVG
jgi:hypothetical protein